MLAACLWLLMYRAKMDVQDTLGIAWSARPIFWPAFRADDGSVGRVSRAGGLSTHSAQAPHRLSQRNGLFCEMVGEILRFFDLGY
jgi:hypothetical protein